MPLNSHFVSRFLTTPWEYGERRLWYYDFKLDQLRSGSSRTLFARVDAHTAEIEARLNRLVETPIADAREQLWAKGDQVSAELEWPLFRALAMLLLLQPFRSADAPDAARTLEEIVSQADEQIDALAYAISSRWQLMRITVSSQSPLVYPSDGYFPLLAEPLNGNCVHAFAIPISPVHAFLGVSRDVSPEQTEIWTTNKAGIVSNYSVGHRSQIVVVHPSIMESLPEAEIVRGIREARAGVVRGLELCREMASVLRQIDAIE